MGRSMCWSAASGRSSRSRRKPAQAQLNQPQSPTHEPPPTRLPRASRRRASPLPAKRRRTARACSRCRRCPNAASQAMSRPCSPGSTSLASWGLMPAPAASTAKSLNEIGITNGSLTIDDRRGGTEWKFTQISLNLNRPKAGGVALTVLSESQERPWAVSAALSPAPQGHRRLQLEARKVVLDDLLALRMSESKIPFRYAGFGLDRLRHRGGRHAADDLGLDLWRRAARSAVRTSPNIKFRSPAPNSGWTGMPRGERCACRSRSRRERRASPCAPNLPRPRCPAATGCSRSAADGSCSIR